MIKSRNGNFTHRRNNRRTNSFTGGQTKIFILNIHGTKIISPVIFDQLWQRFDIYNKVHSLLSSSYIPNYFWKKIYFNNDCFFKCGCRLIIIMTYIQTIIEILSIVVVMKRIPGHFWNNLFQLKRWYFNTGVKWF